ncbi:MAG TPA: hypothetical protein VK186_09060, partial [Candidatus Deferrimicrobium sp.]|nr:hypothetical protein [Candidatus Deferrimicrobium sp.]
MMKKFFNSGRHGGLPLQKYKISDHPKQYRLPIGRLCRGVPPWTPVIFPKLELLLKSPELRIRFLFIRLLQKMERCPF